MRVYEVCSRRVAVARRADRLLDAARRMREEHVGDLVVVEERAAGTVPVGILTDRDIVVGVLAKDDAHLASLDVGDVLADGLVVTASEDEDVGDVLRRMRSFAVRRVPVLDRGGALSGVLSLDDVLAGLAEELAQAARLVRAQPQREASRRP